MALCVRPPEFLLTGALLLGLVFGTEATHAQSPSVNDVSIFLPLGGDTFELAVPIWAIVEFDRGVEVTGVPQLELTIGTQRRPALYIVTPDGPATSMYFRYTVESSDRDTDGISIEANALTLSGGTIKSLDGTANALLDLGSHAPSDSALRKVDGSRETTPEVRGVSISPPSSGGTFKRGEIISIRVWYSRAVAVTGTPQLALMFGTQTRYASFRREPPPLRITPGTPALASGPVHFRYTVAASDSDSNGISIDADALTLNGGTIRIQGGTTNAALDLGRHAISNSSTHKVDGEREGGGETGGRGGASNSAPRRVGELSDLELDVGETVAVDVAAVFADADGDRLRYFASAEGGFISLTIADGTVHVRGVRPGETTVLVSAEDARETATATFQVAVGVRLSVRAVRGTAPEGGTVVFAVELSEQLATPVATRWHVTTDEDDTTPDADEADIRATAGEVSIPVGEVTATIEINIIDDADIEPAREHFLVQLEQPEDENVGLVHNASAEAEIREGVCDRTPAVRDELSRRWQNCQWPKSRDLAAMSSLELHRRNIEALRPNDLLGLPRLRHLDLSENALETLPTGLFEGFDGLREVSVTGNPGAPFALTVELARLDAEPWAPGPAQIVARTAWGAPFAIAATLLVWPADASANLPAMVEIAAGRTMGQQFSAPPNNGTALVLRADAARIPTTQCEGRPCFRGFQTVAGPALTLFRSPPRALALPEIKPLQLGEALVLPLASLVEAEDPLDELRWQATSSDDALATVRIVDGYLEVMPELANAGTAEIALVVTDTQGLSTTLRLNVRVDYYWPYGPMRGWRRSLGNEREQER